MQILHGRSLISRFCDPLVLSPFSWVHAAKIATLSNQNNFIWIRNNVLQQSFRFHHKNSVDISREILAMICWLPNSFYLKNRRYLIMLRLTPCQTRGSFQNQQNHNRMNCMLKLTHWSDQFVMGNFSFLQQKISNVHDLTGDRCQIIVMKEQFKSGKNSIRWPSMAGYLEWILLSTSGPEHITKHC